MKHDEYCYNCNSRLFNVWWDAAGVSHDDRRPTRDEMAWHSEGCYKSYMKWLSGFNQATRQDN